AAPRRASDALQSLMRRVDGIGAPKIAPTGDRSAPPIMKGGLETKQGDRRKAARLVTREAGAPAVVRRPGAHRGSPGKAEATLSHCQATVNRPHPRLARFTLSGRHAPPSSAGSGPALAACARGAAPPPRADRRARAPRAPCGA